jgi:two-component system alkaline phosphatase synthesis response regulator PhoP
VKLFMDIIEKMNVLIIDDEPNIVDGVRKYFEQAGFEVLAAYNGPDGLSLTLNRDIDLVVLDLMLPGLNGLDVCRELRKKSEVPIIMLTARVDEPDILVGLELGADDYITKPFSPRELVARARTVLRRVHPVSTNLPSAKISPSDVYEFPDFVFDAGAHHCIVGGHIEPLTPTEFELLHTLVINRRRVLTRNQLLEAAGLGAFEGVEKTVDVHMHNLRRKIEPDPAQPRYILTVYGVGYRFNDYKT